MSTPENLISILFKVLIGFVVLNVIVNFILLYTRRLKIYKLLAIYWPSVLIMYLLIGKFQSGNLEIILSFGIMAFFTSVIVSIIGLEVVGRKLPFKEFLALFLVGVGLTFSFNKMGLSFTTTALPIAIPTALLLLYPVFHLIFLNRTTRLQKILGFILLLESVHCINFALFRMDPDAQLWGWFVTYVLCDLFAVILPSIALEKSALTENARLQELVSERTTKLNRSLQTNKSLFKVLIHDISNPLMSIKSYLYLLKKEETNAKVTLEKLERAQLALEDIIAQMKSIYFLENKSNIPLGPVSLTECLTEINFIFEEPLKKKGIVLQIEKPDLDIFVFADKTSLTHSVLGNILSNAIKFSEENSKITILIRRASNKVTIEIRDEGPGISKQILEAMLTDQEVLSTEGTQGERGSGLGLSIIKSFMEYFKGDLEFISHKENEVPGTTVRIVLNEMDEL